MTGVQFSSLGKQSLAPIRPWVWSPAQEKKKKTLKFQKLSRSRKLVGMEGTNTDHFSHCGNHKHYRPQRGGHRGLATEKKITAKSYWQLDICTLHTFVLKNIILKCNIHKGCVQGQLPCVTFPNLLHTPLPQRQALVLRIYLEVVAGKWSYSFAPWQSSSTRQDHGGLAFERDAECCEGRGEQTGRLTGASLGWQML